MILRPGAPDDFEKILAWRNSPLAIQYSKSGRALTREDGIKTYGDALSRMDSSRRVLIPCLDPATPIGYLRFDIGAEGNCAEVSIALDAKFQGQGHGTEALKKGCAHAFAHYGVERITAVVMGANEVSVKAFTNAGFACIQNETDFSTYELKRDRRHGKTGE